MGIRGDAHKESWEDSSFPVVCETCLGDNPYVRMQRQKFGQACKVCERPFTVFRWKPGGDARYKKTQLCQACSKTKNVCQVCILDLTYGLPVEVRDSVLAKAQQQVAVVPQGAVNQAYFFSQQRNNVDHGGAEPGEAYTRPAVDSAAHAALMSIARIKPRYKRNLPHICSFFVKGECNRGSSCPYRHEMPPTKKDDPLAKQNMRDRFNGVDDPVAKKIMGRMEENAQVHEPADDSISTVWLGGVDQAKISESDLRDVFYHFGEIRQIKMVRDKACAFVEFVDQQSARNAVQRKHGNCMVRGLSLAVNWSKTAHNGDGGRVHTGGYLTADGEVDTKTAAASPPLASVLGRGGNAGPAIPDSFKPAALMTSSDGGGGENAPGLPPPPPELRGVVYPSMSASSMGAQR